MVSTEDLRKRFELVPEKSDTLLTYHRQLWQARYSPCGRFLIACGYDASIQRWAVGEGEPTLLAPISGHDGWVQCIDFLAQTKCLLSADSWGQLACWKYEGNAAPGGTAEPTWTLPHAHDGWIRALAVSPDETLVATGGNDSVVRLWSTVDGSLRKELPHPLRVYSLRFHPDGESLVSGDLEGKIRQFNLSGGREVRQFDASFLYSHDVENERIQHCGGARHLQFNHDGSRLACAGQKDPQGGFAKGTPCVVVYDWISGEPVREMPMGGMQDGFAYDASFHPDGFVMATSSAFPGKGHVWFWRPEDDEAFFSSSKLANGRSLSLHPDGQQIALLTSDSRNANGRPLKDGEYQGGTAMIRIMRFPGPRMGDG